uniref:Uncharacterized protein n=1 Tax=Aotus nancymaae TaxID=37293 RepID=A0A2K5D0Q8_AOTNA
MGADFQFCNRNYEHIVIVYMISEVICLGWHSNVFKARESEKRKEERKVFKLISFEFKNVY